MADNLPLALPMDVARHIAKRAELAFNGELRACIMAFPDYVVAKLEHELAFAFYREAMKRLEAQNRADADSERQGGTAGRVDHEKRATAQQDANGEGSGERTEEHEALADGSGPVIRGNTVNGERKP